MEAINATKTKAKALLIGNGFSAQHFSYSNLLAEARLEDGNPVKALFEQLNTVDFEVVIHALQDAAMVERAYDNIDQANRFEKDARKVREALVTAVNATHPAHREDLSHQYKCAAAFLEHFAEVFSLNYDLLLYWVNLEKRLLNDGFGRGENVAEGRFKGPFLKNAHCNIFNLHGGLHLFQNEIGETYKALNDGDGVIANITREITENKRLPLYVAEGDSVSKLRKINSVEYLRHCYRILQETTAVVFVFGHSASPNDAHIYHAIFGSKKVHAYFGIFKPDDCKIKAVDAELAKYKKLGGNKVSYSFFASETAHVWSCPPEGEVNAN